ncbi:MAG: murein hydrolase activator EnvC family protein [Chitinophagaceae bacterium]
MKQFFFAFLLLLTAAAHAQTQDRTKLERERQAIQSELKEIQGVYNQVKGQKKETLGQLTLLQRKMALQNQYVSNINKEVRLVTDEIYLSNLEINRLKRQLDTLKEQYARSVVYAYKNKSTYDYLNFIFSANNFNDALKRVSYLKAYRNYREQQVANIRETQALIEDRRQQLVAKQNQKKAALQNQTQQLAVLEDQKKEKDVVVSKLKSKENELARQIAAKRKQDTQLKNSIAAIIRREIEARRKAEAAEAERLRKAEAARVAAAKKDAAATGNTTTTVASPEVKAEPVKKTAPGAIPLNAKEVALSSSFATNRGKLPWPVDNGFVSIHFGSYTVPGTSLKGDNPGITITTPSPGTTVKAVFDGEVIGIFNLGDGMAVTISHGKYFTTYSNLSRVNVSKGSSVKTGQSIGSVAGDDEGGSGGKLDFILMVETNNVNPEPWLRK